MKKFTTVIGKLLVLVVLIVSTGCSSHVDQNKEHAINARDVATKPVAISQKTLVEDLPLENVPEPQPMNVIVDAEVPAIEDLESAPTANKSGLGTYAYDLENPFPLPYFISSWVDWKKLSKAEQEEKISKELGVTLITVPYEQNIAFSWQADGVVLHDLTLPLGLIFEIHESDDRIVYLDGNDTKLSDYDLQTSDFTVRIAHGLTSEMLADGTLCLAAWHSTEYNLRYPKNVEYIGYFKENCSDIPDQYLTVEPDLREKFDYLLRVAGADLTMYGAKSEGVWYFWNTTETQPVSCPEAWICIGSSDQGMSFSFFDSKQPALYSAFLFDPAEGWTAETAEDYALNILEINLSVAP